MNDYISGIQQVGIGVCNAQESIHEYAQLFGMNTLVFDDVSEASLMTCYTGGKIYKRQAMLSLNLQGGGGFEVWQFLNRKPALPATPPLLGDTGIYAPKIKTGDLTRAHQYFSGLPGVPISPLYHHEGHACFWAYDRHGNPFQIVEGKHWFKQNGGIAGGVTGAVIGVSDMEQACRFYRWLLQVDKPVYDQSGPYAFGNKGETGRFRRVLLQKQYSGKGAFGKLLGPVEIELVQCLDRNPQKIYAGRYWGDCGFIHLCFDVTNMAGLKDAAAAKGYKFTVDSIDSFGMEAAAGRFCYMEDPDGTLIELVETHKVPIFRKWGLYLNLKKRGLEKPLPDWMIGLLALSKVK